MAGQSRPLVSVIVPAWNAEATLAETLASVAEQTYRHIEIIIVDDGSTDRTAEIASEFCARHFHARLVRKSNEGLSLARNCGITHARGEFIAPLDADDVWHPTKVEKQVRAALDADHPPGFVYCWYQAIDEQGFVLGSGPRWAFDGPAFQRLAYINPVQNGSTPLLSRSAVLEAGGYDPALRACEDVMIQLRIARGEPIACVPEHLVGYRKRAGSMSSDTILVVRSWREVHRKLVAEGAGIPPRVLRWAEGFFNLALAEHMVKTGSYLRALPAFLSALRHDPYRWGAYLAYRLARTAARLARGRKPRPARLRFDELDPNAVVVSDPDELRALEGLLRRIDERRLARLARSERMEIRDRKAARSARSRQG